MHLNEIYTRALSNSPDKTALICGKETCTYNELDKHISDFTAALIGMGVEKGDRVGLFMPNCLEIIYAYFACFRIGAIAVPSSYYNKVPELIYEAKHCGIKLYIIHEELAHLFHDVQREVPSLEKVCVTGRQSNDSFILFEKQVEKYQNMDLDNICGLGGDTPAVLFYTSGSTGKPKGVTHTHSSLINAAINRSTTLKHTLDDVFITSSFLCHGAAPTIALLPMLYSGGTAVFVSHFDPAEFHDMMFQYYVSFAAASPSQWRDIIDCGRGCNIDFSFLKYATSGGSVVPDKLIEDFYEMSGVPLTASLGMTECGGYMTLPPDEGRIQGSIGKPIFNTEVRLIDQNGNDVPDGDEGEILVRSNSVMKGYWNDPVHTERAFSDGWFHTGDIARKDSEGYYYFCGRLKDTIVVNTGNVTPGEVEDVLNRHPLIEQSVVVGVSDPITEQAVFAYILPKKHAPRVSKNELTEYASANLADRKVPKYWYFVDNFEVSGIVDKIDRKRLAMDAENLIADMTS